MVSFFGALACKVFLALRTFISNFEACFCAILKKRFEIMALKKTSEKCTRWHVACNP
jgi:hypothetical protein